MVGSRLQQVAGSPRSVLRPRPRTRPAGHSGRRLLLLSPFHRWEPEALGGRLPSLGLLSW